MNDRAAKYVERITVAQAHIQAARAAGLRNANQFAAYLNKRAVPAPTNDTWTDDAVHRALKELKARGLDPGSLHRVLARAKVPKLLRSRALAKQLKEAIANGVICN